MKPASAPRDDERTTKLMEIDPRLGVFRHGRIADLSQLLRAGDLLVVNDAATLPASFHGRTAAGADIEVRIVDQLGDQGRFRVVLFGEGDYRTPTERRAPPPIMKAGDRLVLVGAARTATELSARIVSVSPISSRLVDIEFDRTGDALWSRLYAIGHAIQYAHVPRPLDLWSVQTAYASRPWASEMPSAGRPLRWELLLSLVHRGVVVRSLTHAAAISATGDDGIDRALPLPERYDIPESTARAVVEAKRANARVVAVGTSVVRALEGCAAMNGGVVVAGGGRTDLRIDAKFRPRIVDGLLTGMHDDGTSHFDLLSAFAPEPILAKAFDAAVSAGYLGHEFGDSTLILAA